MPLDMLTSEQAIEATLGRGECHEVWNEEEKWFELDCCGRDGWLARGDYCPYCGRKVVEGW